MIALPAGIVAGRYLSVSDEPNRANAAAYDTGRRTRDMYAPGFRNDPYVIDQQRRVVEALEQDCRRSNQHCEAEQARRRVEEAVAGK